MCVAQGRCFCALQAVEEVEKNAFREEERVSQFEPLCIIPQVCCELAWRSSTVSSLSSAVRRLLYSSTIKEENVVLSKEFR